MAIACRDFLPEVKVRGMLSNEYELLGETVARANAWIAADQITVINVETVMQPNLTRRGRSDENGVRTSGEHSSFWFQVVRVWYVPGDHPHPTF
jgi:hypothetical protein